MLLCAGCAGLPERRESNRSGGRRQRRVTRADDAKSAKRSQCQTVWIIQAGQTGANQRVWWPSSGTDDPRRQCENRQTKPPPRCMGYADLHERCESNEVGGRRGARTTRVGDAKTAKRSQCNSVRVMRGFQRGANSTSLAAVLGVGRPASNMRKLRNEANPRRSEPLWAEGSDRALPWGS